MKSQPQNQLTMAIPEAWQRRFYQVVQLRYCVWLMLLALGFIAWNRGLALLYGGVAMLLACMILSAVLPKLYLWRIQARFLKIEPIHVGDSLTIKLAVHAQKPAFGIHLNIPFIDEDADEQFFALAAVTSQPQIVSETFQPTKRGHFVFSSIQARCAYPFGLFTFNQTLPAMATECTIYPKLLDIHALPNQWLSGANQSAEHPHRQHNGDDLFMGLRDYRLGDNVRRIDWRASARNPNSSIVVREYEQLEQPSLLIMINSNAELDVGDGERNALEHSLSIAASLARYALSQGFHTVYAGACQGKVASSYQLTDFYHQLAMVKAQPNTSYPQQVNHAIAEHTRASIIVSFGLQTIASQPNQYQKHWQCVFDGQSYLKPLMRSRPQNPEVNGHCITIPIHASANLERLFNDGH